MRDYWLLELPRSVETRHLLKFRFKVGLPEIATFPRNTVGVVINQFRRNDGWDGTDKAKYSEEREVNLL